MYYISKAPNGNPMVSFQPPVGKKYMEVETLPEGDGPLLFTPSGELYRGAVIEVPDPGPTTDERVTVLEEENSMLKAQIEAQSAQMDFYEDCIAEMAMVVYA